MLTPYSRCYTMPHQQQGLALFVSMMLLLIITIMGMMSLRSTSFQETMVANARDRLIAFQAAESAIFQAEKKLESDYGSGGQALGAAFTAACTNGLCVAVANDGTHASDTENWLSGAAWANAATVSNVGVAGITGTQTAPKYLIELQENNCFDINPPNFINLQPNWAVIFRITARGVGASADTVVVLQSNYGVSGIDDAGTRDDVCAKAAI